MSMLFARQRIGLLLSMALLLPAQQQPPETGTVPVFRGQSNLILIPVFARDSQGRPVSGLKKEDFTILENGKPQQISVFEFQKLGEEPKPALIDRTATVDTPAAAGTDAPRPVAGSARFRDRRLMVLFFDLSSMPPADQIRAQKAALDFVAKKLTPSDLVSIMSFGTKFNVDQEFTDDRDRLVEVLQKFRIGEASDLAGLGSTGPDAADAADDAAGFSADDTEFNVFNTDRKLSALESAARQLASLPEKKAMIYFTAGITRTGMENESQLRSTVNAAVRANVSIYSIDVRGLVAMPPGGDASSSSPRGTGLYTGGTQTKQRDSFNSQQETLVTLAADTGGKALLDNNDLGVGMQQAQKDLQSYYLLGYYTTNGVSDGRFRRIQVKLASSVQAKLDYRNGYYAAKEFKAFNSADKERQLEEALLLGDPLTELPLAVEVDAFRLSKDSYFVPVAAKIPGSVIPLAKKGTAGATAFDFIGQVRDAKGQLVSGVRDAVPIKLQSEDAAQLSRKSLTYDTGFTLAPGQYTFKLLVRENQTGKMGTFETRFQVPAKEGKGQLQTSSVVWSSQREPLQAAVGSAEKQKKLLEQHPLVRNGQKLIPSITKVFRRDQNLYVYLEVYDPASEEDTRRRSVAASVSLFRGTTKALESAPVRSMQPVQGRAQAMPVQLQVPLKSLSPGQYICQVNVVDEVGRKFHLERAPVVVLP